MTRLVRKNKKTEGIKMLSLLQLFQRAASRHGGCLCKKTACAARPALNKKTKKNTCTRFLEVGSERKMTSS